MLSAQECGWTISSGFNAVMRAYQTNYALHNGMQVALVRRASSTYSPEVWEVRPDHCASYFVDWGELILIVEMV